jgi:phosphate starvation-inducible protein PhoH
MAKNNGKAKSRRSSRQQYDDEQFESIMKSGEAREDEQKSELIKRVTINKSIKYKNHKQKELIKMIHENQIVFIKGAAGTGKAQPLDEPVLTPNGFVPMGSLKVGDQVISVDGSSTDVIGVFPQGELETFRVEFSDGTFTECCGEHLWYTDTYLDRMFRTHKVVVDENGNKKRKYSRKPRAGSVKNTIEIMNTLRIGKKNRINHSIPLCKPVEFKFSSELDLDPYVMGLLLGDGSIKYGQTSISTADQEILEYLNEWLNDSVSVKHRSGYDYAITSEKKQVGSNYVRTALKKYGVSGCGPKDKFIPKEYLYSSISDRISLLQGLMDSDGYCDKRGNCEFSTISNELVDGMNFLVRSLGGTVKTRSKVPTYTDSQGCKVTGQLSYTLSINFSSEINPFRLSRKANRYHPRTKYFRKYVSNVVPIGKKQAQCIMVDHDSRLYLTRDFIVTHNTFIALKAALEVLQDDGNDINKITLTKPIVEAGESIGFLPGDADEKTQPYMKSFEDNIKELIGKEATRNMIAAGVIEAMPLSFIRGNTFRRSISILDEAQNTTPMAMKLFLSRIGETSKMVIIGDTDQTDLMLRNNEIHGLEDAFRRFEKKGLKGIGFFEFTEDDIVRSKILIELMKCYKNS